MTAEERKQAWKRLETLELLARAARWRRLLHRPLHYLSATLFHRFLYPVFSKGWKRRAKTFFKASMQVILPAGTDIFLLGGKTHDSEIRLSRFLLRELQSGDNFVDVGAHLGFFSLLAARLTSPAGRVLAIEASPKAYELLAANLRGITEVHPLHYAAADQNGYVTFYPYPVFFSEFSSLNSTPPSDTGTSRKEMPTPVTVPGKRLDTLLSEAAISKGFLKIDVEGAEDKVIRGLTAVLEQKPVHLKIIMEYFPPHKNNSSHREAAKILYRYGFKSFRIDADGALIPCPEIERYLVERNIDSDNVVFLPRD